MIKPANAGDRRAHADELTPRRGARSLGRQTNFQKPSHEQKLLKTLYRTDSLQNNDI
jgi:hypothetical protein